VFGSDAGRVMGEDENGDLEFVVAHLGVGVGHLERPAARENGAGLGDGVVHVRGVAERGLVWIMAAGVAILIGDETVKRDGHADDYFRH
jgi:hypothetical protein